MMNVEDRLTHLLIRLGWLWRLTMDDVRVYVDVYTYGNVMGRLGKEWEWQSYERLLDAGWIRQVNSVSWDDGSSNTNSKKGVTAVYKAVGLLCLVEIYQREMQEFLDVMEGVLCEVIELGDLTLEDNAVIKGKNDVYKWVKQCEKRVEALNDKSVIEKYTP